MAIPAETAIRDWVNGRSDLVGTPDDKGPLANGAFLWKPRSPAAGAYAVLSRQPLAGSVMAEPAPGLDVARISAVITAGTQEAAEPAAAAYATAVRSLTGRAENCGGTGIQVLSADNVTGPSYVPQPPDSGELYAFAVTADFLVRST